MIDPLPAAMGSVEPQYSSRVRSKRFKAARTVLPISKQLPVLLRLPQPILADVTLQLIHRVEAAALDETLARQRAIDVSSVHAPAGRLNGPPPTMSAMGASVPGTRNSS